MIVSFVVIGKNEGWRLEKCFKSLYSFVETEGIKEFEVVYVDSRSSDDSISQSLSYKNKTIVIEGECNAAIARNIGAKESSGDILFFIDGDMELLAGFWSSVVKDGKLIYPSVSGMENDVLHDNDWSYKETKVRRTYMKDKEQYEITTGGLFIIDRALWVMVGGMDNRQKKCQDLDFGFWLYRYGHKLLRKPDIWVNHYTQYYAVRSGFNVDLAKYQSLLTRKHILSFTVEKFMLHYNYSFWLLCACLLLMIGTMSLCPIAIYLSAATYRAFKTYSRTKSEMGYLSLLKDRIIEDAYFLFYFATFWPKQPEVKYKIIEQ